MYYFVEFLRASRALRIAGIILGLMFLAGVILRLSFINGPSPESYINVVSSSPTAHVSQTKLPDGTTRETIDDPVQKKHATIVRSAAGVTIDVVEPAKAANPHHDVMAFGHVDITHDTHNGMTHTRIAYRPGFNVDWGGLFFGSLLIGFIVATILAGPLAKENDGHLELAWTKPVARENYALSAVAVDAITIWISQLVTIIVVLLCALMWTVPKITLGAGGFTLILLELVAPLAWYACLTAFSASVKRGPGLVIGLGWLVALIIPAVAGATTNSINPVGHAFNVVFSALCYIDPLVYLPSFHGNHVQTTGIVKTIGEALVGAAILFIGYIAIAVLQWRRVEA